MNKIMNSVKILTIGLTAFLFGCGKAIMPPITYDKPIDFHVNKNAFIHWQYGKQCNATVVPNQGQSDLISAAVTAALRSDEDDSKAQVGGFSYGKAEQAIFVTSFKNVLEQNHVFNHVELMDDSTKLSQKDVLIDVFFKTARVTNTRGQLKITLTVVMNIRAGGKPVFERKYLSQKYFDGGSFVDQQQAVSKDLMEKLIGGIKEWQQKK